MKKETKIITYAILAILATAVILNFVLEDKVLFAPPGICHDSDAINPNPHYIQGTTREKNVEFQEFIDISKKTEDEDTIEGDLPEEEPELPETESEQTISDSPDFQQSESENSLQETDTKKVSGITGLATKSSEEEYIYHTDSCDGRMLTEWFCVSTDFAGFEIFECPTECDEGACVATCGDEIQEPVEFCELEDALDCITDDEYPGKQNCKTDCSGYEQECSTELFCGDGSIDGVEECDEGELNTDEECVPNCGEECTYCDLTCKQITITGETCPAPSSSSPSSGGSGGGGGGGSIIQTGSIKSVPSELSITTIKDQTEERAIAIVNEYNRQVSLTLSTTELGNAITFDKTSFTIPAKGQENIKLTINAEEEKLIAGKIIVKEGSSKRLEIPIILNVKTENFLFDAKIQIPETSRSVFLGDKLLSQVSLVQLGEQTKLDIVATYEIKDFEGNTYKSESETFAVEQRKDYEKEFSTEELPTGDYVLGLEIVYPGAFAVSSDQFKIQSKQFIRTQTIIIVASILALIIAVIAITLTLKNQKHRRHSRKTKKKKRKH